MRSSAEWLAHESLRCTHLVAVRKKKWKGIYLRQTHGYPHLMRKRFTNKCSLEKLENVFGLIAHLTLDIRWLILTLRYIDIDVQNFRESL